MGEFLFCITEETLRGQINVQNERGKVRISMKYEMILSKNQ